MSPRKKKIFKESVEDRVNKVIYEEYESAKGASISQVADFESVIDMLECKRTEKDYDWMSDIFIPELPSIILTDASAWANQYFQSRDFVEVKLEGTHPLDQPKSQAAKLCINQTLNNRAISHYQKYIRARTINALYGHVYAVGWWEQELKDKLLGYKEEKEELTVDQYGNEISTPDQIPAVRINQVPQYGKEVIKDHFNYEVIDPRNVFTDSRYCYSIQEKDWIIIRSETTYDELKANEKKMEYINLDKVKELVKTQGKTKTAEETYNKDEDDKEPSMPAIRKFDKLLRFGKFWCKVKDEEKDASGYPFKAVPGIDEFGEISENAELVECITETVISGSTKVLIRFQPTPFRDTRGTPYKPIIRGWCYIHPTKDIGLSSGKYLRELQIAINDGFNMGMDREKLSTMPTLKGKKYALEDNQTIYFEPQHMMELESPDDVEEFKLDSNITGMLQLVSMLISKGQQVESIYPTTMGQLPTEASTTATAVAGAESRTNLRANYKSLTFEYTYLLDFYWMILQMTYAFATEETALKMMGKLSEVFDPDGEYSYSPVSSNIEMEYNKNKKISLYDQTLGRLQGLVKVVPQVLPIIAHIIRRQLELQGDEYQTIAGMIEKLAKAQVQPEQGGGQGGQKPGAQVQNIPERTSNQQGYPQLGLEQDTREGMEGIM
jgi:hypothetical protein